MFEYVCMWDIAISIDQFDWLPIKGLGSEAIPAYNTVKHLL